MIGSGHVTGAAFYEQHLPGPALSFQSRILLSPGSLISNVVDVRDPIQIAYDHLA
jgi:hypothetical protein